jgi:micrococcal nuclease
MLKIAALLLLASSLQTASGREMKFVEGKAYVVDGDTVVVSGVRVRLKGVDASELGTLRGEAARREMERIVGKSLACDLTGEKTWRREVGFCFNDEGQDIGEEIVKSGAALACPRYSRRYLKFERSEALEAQTRARYC